MSDLQPVSAAAAAVALLSVIGASCDRGTRSITRTRSLWSQSLP